MWHETLFGLDAVRPEGDQREQAEQGRGGAQDREIRPLPQSLDAEVAANLGQGDLDPPAPDEPAQDRCGFGIEVGAQEGSLLPSASCTSTQRISTRLPG